VPDARGYFVEQVVIMRGQKYVSIVFLGRFSGYQFEVELVGGLVERAYRRSVARISNTP
jgi:hypothetical protein